MKFIEIDDTFLFMNDFLRVLGKNKFQDASFLGWGRRGEGDQIVACAFCVDENNRIKLC